MQKESQSEPPEYFYIIPLSEAAYVLSTDISDDSVMELGRGRLEDS